VTQFVVLLFVKRTAGMMGLGPNKKNLNTPQTHIIAPPSHHFLVLSLFIIPITWSPVGQTQMPEAFPFSYGGRGV
jgi:hypothetical protein